MSRNHGPSNLAEVGVLIGYLATLHDRRPSWLTARIVDIRPNLKRWSVYAVAPRSSETSPQAQILRCRHMTGWPLRSCAFFWAPSGSIASTPAIEQSAFFQLLTAGGCGIWWLFDLLVIVLGNFRDSEGRLVTR